MKYSLANLDYTSSYFRPVIKLKIFSYIYVGEVLWCWPPRHEDQQLCGGYMGLMCYVLYLDLQAIYDYIILWAWALNLIMDPA